MRVLVTGGAGFIGSHLSERLLCAGHDVVQGYADNTYHPERAVTRDQMAVYVARGFGLLP